MKYDNIIIGGGLAGLVAGIRLQQAGKKCAIISSGQSALHFSAGSFDVLGRHNDEEVTNPLEIIPELPLEHPYQRVGIERTSAYLNEISGFFNNLGIRILGDPSKNVNRMSPTGNICTTCFTFNDFEPLLAKDEHWGKSVLVVNIQDYLDFNTKFISNALDSMGAKTRVHSINIEEMDRLRKNPSEMRAANIARVMDRGEAWKKVIVEVNKLITDDDDMVILPAVFGLKDDKVLDELRKEIKTKLIFLPTMPPSVPGIRTQMRLKEAFESLGGNFIMGDVVESAIVEGDEVKSLTTHNFGDISISADNYILATGSFFSKGLIATPTKIFEPIFDIDLEYNQERSEWYDAEFFNDQNYISFGAKFDDSLRAIKNGRLINNLYVCGSILSGANTLKQASGGGVTIVTSLTVADNILSK